MHSWIRLFLREDTSLPNISSCHKNIRSKSAIKLILNEIRNTQEITSSAVVQRVFLYNLQSRFPSQEECVQTQTTCAVR
jgi:hypothetical protein